MLYLKQGVSDNPITCAAMCSVCGFEAEFQVPGREEESVSMWLLYLDKVANSLHKTYIEYCLMQGLMACPSEEIEVMYPVHEDRSMIGKVGLLLS